MKLGQTLAELEKTVLIRRVAEAEPTYFFHHTLTQESIYQALLKQPRRELHLAVARAYEQVYAGQLDENAALLAEHYAAAQDDAKTFEYSARAGHAAMRVYASAEVVAHFTRAVETAKRLGTIDSALLQDSYLHLGRALELSGRFQEALQNYEEMESLALKRDDRAMQLAALVALATIHSTATVLSDEAHARTLSNLALGLAREIRDRETEARVLWNLMLLSSSIGEMQQALDYGEQSLVISRELGMDEQTAYTLNDLFRPYMSLGQYDRAREGSEQAREYFRESSNLPMLVDNLGRSNIVNAVFGEFDRALELADEGYKISEAIGNPWGQSFSQMFTGNIYFHRGEVGRAIDRMRESIRLGQASGFLLPQIWTNAELGSIYGELGEVNRGLELANQSYALAAARFPRSIARAHAILARLFLLRGDVPQAEFHVEQGKAKFIDDFAQRTFDRLPLIEIELELVKKDYARAIQLADELGDRPAQIYIRVFQSELLYLKGKALLARGDSESAQQVLRDALTAAEKIGSRWMQWQIYAALGERKRARAIAEFIAENTPQELLTPLGPSLRESFLNLPSVQAVMKLMPLETTLAQLENAQLIRAVAESDPAYIFKNILSQQAAYQSLLAKNRRELHRCVAETYEKLYADRLNEIAAMLAQHYAEAGDNAKTFEYSARAGDGSARVYANAEAVTHYSRAIEIARRDGISDGARLRDLYLKNGRALELIGRYDEVLKNYEEMETLGHTRGDRAMELDALIALATIRSTPNILFDATLAQALSDWALKVAREIGDRASEAKILWNLLNLSLFTMQIQPGIKYGEQALAIAHELGLKEQTAYILNDINRLYLAGGEINKAKKSVAEAQVLWQELDNQPMLADNLASAAEVSHYAGELDASLKFSQQALVLARSIGNSWCQSYSLSVQANFFFERGEISKAIDALTESLIQAEQAGFLLGVGAGRGDLAMLYGYLGAVDRGIASMQQVLRDLGPAFDPFRPLVMAYLARLNIRKGDVGAAQAALNEAREKFATDQFVIYISAPLALATAELALAKGEFAGAIDALEPIIAKDRETGAQYLLLDTFLVQGEAFTKLGKTDQAEKIFAQARTRAEAMQSRRILWLVLLKQSRAAASGDHAAADVLRDQARAIVEFIAQHTPEEFRASFLNLPNVRMVLE